MQVPSDRRSIILVFLVSMTYAVANFLLRRHEVSFFTLTPYLHPGPKLTAAPWHFLLPFDIGGGFIRWSTTGLALQYFLEQATSPAMAYYCLNAFLITTAAACVFYATRSVYAGALFLPFIAFGSQFYWYYQITAVGLYYVGYCYILVNLACLYRLLLCPTKSALLPRFFFIFSLVCVAIWYEQWLDYGSFLVVFCILTFILRARLQYVNKKQSLFAAFSIFVIIFTYIFLKVLFLSTEEYFHKGREAEVVLSYFSDLPFWQAALLAVHDVCLNAARYLFMSLLSPLLSLGCLPELPLFAIGPAKVVAAQNGYHPKCTQLTYYSHLFSWYVPVGMVCILFIQTVIKNCKLFFTTFERYYYINFALILLIVFGAFTHDFVKFRPYNSLPLLHYKVMLGTLAAYILYARFLYKKTFDKSARIKIIICLLLSASLIGNALAFHNVMLFMRDNVYNCERR